MSQEGHSFNGEQLVDQVNPLDFIRQDICFLGKVEDRGKEKRFGILRNDRLKHVYVIGKSGMGKSTLLENMILQDIYNGDGVCFVDPHGESAMSIIDKIPPHRHKDVVYFNPADSEYPIGFNMLEAKNEEAAFLVVSGIVSIFKKIWKDAWSSRMEYILNNTLLALTESSGNTLLGVLRMFTDSKFRARIIDRVDDPMVITFWKKEYTSWSDKYRTEAIAPIQNKIGQFFASDIIRNILGQAKSTINFREIMDGKKIFIANLSKGRIGEDHSMLLGSMLVTKLQLAALSRIDIVNQEQRPDFYVYVDEFQNFTTDSFATILSEARKYRVGLTIAHQYIGQLTESGSENVKNAVFGNVGTMISFKVGAQDAIELEREFSPTYLSPDFLYLNRGQVVMKMTINDRNTSPFSAQTMPPIFENFGGNTESIIGYSRNFYARPKELVKRAIVEWLENKRPISEVRMSDLNIGTSLKPDKINTLNSQAYTISSIPEVSNNKNISEDKDISSPTDKLAFLRKQNYPTKPKK